jgi:mannose/cellobiose epimerase-like protein (N-acyl-D-glucosamine 2-epimerase family)
MLAGALATALLLGSCCLSFWQQHGLDSEFGGFHGTLDRAGTPVSPTNKGLIEQTRHIWCAKDTLVRICTLWSDSS